MQHRDLIADLLAIGALQMNTKNYFTWSSGVQSPVYCDNRLTMSYPSIRKQITNNFTAVIKRMDIHPDIIAGCATAGIPHAAWLSEVLDLPMIYVRSKPKSHGKENQIEGAYQPGQDVLVIEDLISTGASSINAANALRTNGLNVLGVSAIFSYGLQRADVQFQKENLPYQTILTFDEVLDYIDEMAAFSADDVNALFQWRNEL